MLIFTGEGTFRRKGEGAGVRVWEGGGLGDSLPCPVDLAISQKPWSKFAIAPPAVGLN